MIDWHNHILAPTMRPPTGSRGAWPGVRKTPDGYQMTRAGQNYRAVDERVFDPVVRAAALPDAQVRLQVLSPPPLAAAFDGPVEEHAQIASIQNDFMATACADSPDTYRMLALIPWQSPELAAAELARLEALPGVVGVCLTAHRDEPSFSDVHYAPIWELLSANSWLVFVHPDGMHVDASDSEAGSAFSIGMPMAGGRTAAVLLTSGLLSDHPDLQVVVSHAGGVFPALAHRLEREWRMGRGRLQESPLVLARRHLWLDSVAYSPATLRLAAEVVGHNRLVFGSDFPFEAGIGVSDLAAMGDEWAGVLERNGRALLDLTDNTSSRTTRSPTLERGVQAHPLT